MKVKKNCLTCSRFPQWQRKRLEAKTLGMEHRCPFMPEYGSIMFLLEEVWHNGKKLCNCPQYR